LLQAVAPGLWSLNAHLWLHVLLAPWAFAWLGRRLGLAPSAALAGGAFYGLSGFVLSHLAFANLAPGAVLAPAVAAAWLGCRRDASPLQLVALGCLWALVLLGGDPLYAVLAGSMVLAVEVLGLPRELGERLAPGRPGRTRGVLALAAGTLLAAPQLGELWRVLPSSLRGVRGFDAAARTVASWDPRQAVEWLLPLVFGRLDRLERHRFWGEALHPGDVPLFLSLAPGVLVLALVAGAGLRRRAARVGWCLVVAGIFLALGRFNPALRLLEDLPGISLLRFPVKAWLLVAPGLCLVAAAGWEGLFLERERLSRRRVTCAVAVLAALVAALVVPPTLGLAGPSLASWLPATLGAEDRAAEVGRWAAVGGLTLLLLAASLPLVRARRRPVLAGCLLVAAHVAGQVALLDPIAARERVATLDGAPRLTAGLERGHWAHGRNGALFGPPRVPPGPSDDARLLVRQGAYSALPFVGISRGFRYELDPSPEGLDAFVTHLARDAVKMLDDAARVRLLALWGVERLVLDRPLAARTDARLERSGTAYGARFYLYGLSAVPAVRRVEGSRSAASPGAALARLLAPSFDPRREVVLAGRGPATPGGAGRLEVFRDEPSRLDLVTTGERPGWVVVERTFHPVYRAEVDGEPAELRLANLHRIAISVPAGPSRVTLRYDKRPLYLELVLAVLGALLLALVAFGSRAPVVTSASS
jgi:hypothetical protein